MNNDIVYVLLDPDFDDISQFDAYNWSDVNFAINWDKEKVLVFFPQYKESKLRDRIDISHDDFHLWPYIFVPTFEHFILTELFKH
jgi:hypothetical protein